MNYSDYAGQSDLKGWFRPVPGPLTPLHEQAAPHVTKLPADIRDPLIFDYYERRDAATNWDGRYAAQDWIADEVATLRRARLDVAFDEQAIDDEARKWAAICNSLVTFEAARAYVEALGVDIPKVKGNITLRGITARLHDVRWWRRQFRKHYTRTAENKLRELGHVQKRRQLYASDRAVNWRRVRKSRDRAMLKEMVAISDAGDQLELWGIVEKSQANPALRRAELMTRLRGFENVAEVAAHVADFWTLTAPSAFHRTHASGERNEKWEGFTVRDAQAWLCKMWAKARAKLKRLSVLFYGFRIAEPHHDGTPHWHAVFFMPEQHRETVRVVLRECWLSEYGHEQGARDVRVQFKAIDRAKGSACGYVSKYIAKNVDGFQVGEDFEGEAGTQATQSCDRVAAWASAHGIRQFQQLGGPQVSIWRELRRLHNCIDDAPHSVIESARQAADAGEWATFIAALGGIAQGRRGAVQLWTAHTGELTRYDELRGAQVTGVQCAASRVRTRDKTWRIQRAVSQVETHRAASDQRVLVRKSTLERADGSSPSGSPSSLGPVSITVRAEFIAAYESTFQKMREGPPWQSKPH